MISKILIYPKTILEWIKIILKVEIWVKKVIQKILIIQTKSKIQMIH